MSTKKRQKSWFQEAMQREVTPDERQPRIAQVGVDVAGDGANRTVIAARIGRRLMMLRSYAKTTNVEVCNLVRAAVRDLFALESHGKPVLDHVAVLIDKVGIGTGVADTLALESSDQCAYIGVASNEAPYDRVRFNNRRDEMYHGLRELFRPGSFEEPVVLDVTGEEVHRLGAQVTQSRWDYVHNQRFTVESKRTMADRGVPSPDEADSVAMAFAPWEHEFTRRVDPAAEGAWRPYRIEEY